MSKYIQKKIKPEYYSEVVAHRKNFELRADEDDIQPGDWLILNEYREREGRYTGRKTSRRVQYVLRDCEEYGLKPGYCIISFL